MDFPKYPRTYHLQGSKGIKEANNISFNTVLGVNLAIEEKVDGSCVGIAFDQKRLILKHRNNEVDGMEWDLLKKWIRDKEELFYDILENRYIMYGGWLYATHTIYYDKLPHFFLEYDIFDSTKQYFLSTPQRQEILKNTPIASVKCLSQGIFKSSKDIISLLGPSFYRNIGNMEGLYLKVEDDLKVKDRYKFISKEFLDGILTSGTHWMNRFLTKNIALGVNDVG